MKKSIIHDALRALRKGTARMTPEGLYVPDAKVCIGGIFSAYDLDEDGRKIGEGHNRVVTTGLNRILNVLVGHNPSPTFYLAPFINDVEPQANWTGANFPSLAGEFTAYAAATRPQWVTVPATTAELTNIAGIANATLTLNAGGPYTIRGCGLLESSGKGSTTGALFAAGRFDDDITGLSGGGKLGLEYRLGARDSADPAP